MVSTFNYTNLKNTATNLIAKFGQVATFRKVTVGTYNTATGKVTNTTSDTSVKIVLLDYNMALKNKPDSLVKDNDRKVLMAASSIAVNPSTNDLIIIGSDTYTITSIPEILNPGGTVLMYEFHVRK